MNHTAGASMPPLTLSHSTSTVPLNAAGSVGTRAAMPRRVVGGVGRADGPVPVAVQRPGRGVGRRGPGHEVFGDGVAEVGHVEGPEQQGGAARHRGDGGFAHGGHLTGRSVNTARGIV